MLITFYICSTQIRSDIVHHFRLLIYINAEQPSFLSIKDEKWMCVISNQTNGLSIFSDVSALCPIMITLGEIQNRVTGRVISENKHNRYLDGMECEQKEYTERSITSIAYKLLLTFLPKMFLFYGFFTIYVKIISQIFLVYFYEWLLVSKGIMESENCARTPQGLPHTLPKGVCKVLGLINV